jgi:hypothetical protein
MFFNDKRKHQPYSTKQKIFILLASIGRGEKASLNIVCVTGWHSAAIRHAIGESSG